MFTGGVVTTPPCHHLTPHTSHLTPHTSLYHWRQDTALWQQRCLLWAVAWLRRGGLREREVEEGAGPSLFIVPAITGLPFSLPTTPFSLSLPLTVTAAFHSWVFPPREGRETAEQLQHTSRPAGNKLEPGWKYSQSLTTSSFLHSQTTSTSHEIQFYDELLAIKSRAIWDIN